MTDKIILININFTNKRHLLRKFTTSFTLSYKNSNFHKLYVFGGTPTHFLALSARQNALHHFVISGSGIDCKFCNGL